jgi:hypothetical protein
MVTVYNMCMHIYILYIYAVYSKVNDVLCTAIPKKMEIGGNLSYIIKKTSSIHIYTILYCWRIWCVLENFVSTVWAREDDGRDQQWLVGEVCFKQQKLMAMGS